MPRAVAFLDILGFKQLLQSMPLHELVGMYEGAIQQTAELNQRSSTDPKAYSYLPSHKPGEPWCYRQVFSDSIVLIALDESAESCLKLLFYTRLLFIFMLARKLPVRGAVAAGELYHNSATAVTLGDALTAAYLMEGQQEWAGVCIADSVWEAFPDLHAAVEDPHGALSIYFLKYPIPWKNTPQPAHRILNWRFNSVFEHGSRALLENARLHHEPKKYDNVIAYLRHVRQSGAVHFLDGSPKPAECQTIWIGPTKPPFKHGDDL